MAELAGCPGMLIDLKHFVDTDTLKELLTDGWTGATTRVMAALVWLCNMAQDGPKVTRQVCWRAGASSSVVTMVKCVVLVQDEALCACRSDVSSDIGIPRGTSVAVSKPRVRSHGLCTAVGLCVHDLLCTIVLLLCCLFVSEPANSLLRTLLSGTRLSAAQSAS